MRRILLTLPDRKQPTQAELRSAWKVNQAETRILANVAKKLAVQPEEEPWSFRSDDKEGNRRAMSDQDRMDPGELIRRWQESARYAMKGTY